MKKMFKLGMNIAVSNIAIGSLPESDITKNMSKGYGEFSKAFPAYGAIKGTTFTLGATKKLFKKVKFK